MNGTALEVEDPVAEREVREALALLQRARKSVQIYGQRNDVACALVTQLEESLIRLAAELGPIDLAVESGRILLGETVVYEDHDPRRSLAFLLFNDGLRWLRLLPGLTSAEVQRFLSCIARASLNGADSTIVELLWEADFLGLDYVVVDELDQGWRDGDVAASVADGFLGILPQVGEGRSGDGVSQPSEAALHCDSELQQPPALPVHCAVLSDEEWSALCAQIFAEARLAPLSDVPELAAELVRLGASDDERHQIAGTLVSLIERQLSEGQTRIALWILDRVNEIADTTYAADSSVAELRVAVERAILDGQRLRRILAALEAGSADAASLAELLAWVSKRSPGALVESFGEAGSKELRRAVTEVMRPPSDAVLRALAKRLQGEVAPSAQLAPELGCLLDGAVRPAVLPLLQWMIRSSQPQLHRQAAWLAGRLGGDLEGCGRELLLGLVTDEDPAARRLALAALLQKGDAACARKLFDLAMASGQLEDPEDRRRAFAIVARHGGDRTVRWFQSILDERPRKWRLRRRDLGLMQAAAHGLLMVGSSSAYRLLRGLAKSGNRSQRSACRSELQRVAFDAA